MPSGEQLLSPDFSFDPLSSTSPYTAFPLIPFGFIQSSGLCVFADTRSGICRSVPDETPRTLLRSFNLSQGSRELFKRLLLVPGVWAQTLCSDCREIGECESADIETWPKHFTAARRFIPSVPLNVWVYACFCLRIRCRPDIEGLWGRYVPRRVMSCFEGEEEAFFPSEVAQAVFMSFFRALKDSEGVKFPFKP